MLNEDKEALLFQLNDESITILGDASIYVTQEDREYLTKLIEADLNG